MMASSSTPTNIAGRAEQMSPRQIPALHTTQPGSDPAVPHNIHYLEEGVQEDASYQVQWSNWMSDGQQKSYYKQVFVLLLSWHPQCDDMAVDPEVRRLKKVFEDTYNYKVDSVLIDSRLPTLAQVQANRAVANFVGDNDQEDTLFIVYYAGHGSPGKDRGDLKMSGRRKQEDVEIAQQFSHITWNHVEANLKTTRADVFLIFDCCHASDLGRESVLNSRSFEYLAASTSNYTRSPGRQSFTSALIWALEQLAPQSGRAAPTESPMFTTSKLAKRICDYPEFPKDQQPSLVTRDIDAWKHIILAPLPREGVSAPTSAPSSENKDLNGEEDEDDKAVPQFLSLTFHFKHKQNEIQFKKLADDLKRFMKLDNTSLYKVQWGGIWGGSRRPRGHRLREAVFKVMSQSPVSGFKNSTFASSGVQQGSRLSPDTGHHPPFLSTERTPLLSGTSSVTFEGQESTTQSIWSRISSFFRGFWEPTLSEDQVQPSGPASSGGGKTFKNWTYRLADKLRKVFYRPPPLIQVTS